MKAIPAPSLTILIQIDALRHDYITQGDAPFLSSLAEQSLSGRLMPTYGFEPDGAYLAGLWPDECDGGAHYWYEPKATPFRFDRKALSVLNALPDFPDRLLRKGLTTYVRTTTAYPHETVSRIPFGQMRFFAPAHKQPFTAPSWAEGRPTIFSLCDANNIAWFFHGAPLCAVDAESGATRILNKVQPPIRFAFWHIGNLDKVGHKYGPDSPERRTAMRYVDGQVKQVVNELSDRYGALHCIVMGDHGMIQVCKTLDVHSALQRGGIHQGEGVRWFLDSTMARFWFWDEGTRERVFKLLQDLPGGRVLTQQDRDHYHLNYGHNRFGELIYQADAGVLISLNFYQGNRMVQGMHGYRPECSDQQSAFILHSPLIVPGQLIEVMDMRRMASTIAHLLDISHTLPWPDDRIG